MGEQNRRVTDLDQAAEQEPTEAPTGPRSDSHGSEPADNDAQSNSEHVADPLRNMTPD